MRDVVDLRADWELATAGQVPEAFTTHRVVLVADADRAASHEVLRTGGLAGYYGWILSSSRHMVGRLVEIVADAPRPAAPFATTWSRGA